MAHYLSWNAYLAYVKCPLRYENIYITKKPATVIPDDYNLIYGSVLHQVCETFYKKELWRLGKGCQDRLLIVAKESFSKILQKGHILWGKPERKTPEALLQEILRDIPKVIQAVKKYRLLGSPVFVEYEVVTSFMSSKIGGRLDLLISCPQGLTLLDGKGAKHRDPEHSKQLLYYVLSYYLLKKEIPKFTGIWYFREGIVEWFSFTGNDLKELENSILKVLGQIKSKEFKPTEDKQNCFWCNYKNTCQKNVDDLETPYGEIVEASF